MDLRSIKRVVKRVTGIGVQKIKIAKDKESLKKAKEAITAEDIKQLIKEKIITLVDRKGVSRYRGRINQLKREKGRRRGKGTKRGTRNARLDGKTAWISKVRAQRRTLNYLKSAGIIDKQNHRHLYRMVKGGYFKSKSALITYINEKSLSNKHIDINQLKQEMTKNKKR